MFLLRCAFFLAIVYAGIVCGVGTTHGPRTTVTAVAGEGSGLAATAMARAGDWCVGHPTQCLRDAHRLTALIETTGADPVFDAADVGFEVATPSAPMPVPDPRRRAARSLLTDAR